jgi:hypothetical protein
VPPGASVSAGTVKLFVAISAGVASLLAVNLALTRQEGQLVALELLGRDFRLDAIATQYF